MSEFWQNDEIMVLLKNKRDDHLYVNVCNANDFSR